MSENSELVVDKALVLLVQSVVTVRNTYWVIEKHLQDLVPFKINACLGNPMIDAEFITAENVVEILNEMRDK